MSGYNQETGIFGLTWTKASFWFRRESEDIPESCRALRETGRMEFFACFLRHHDLEVLHVDRAYLNVRATPSKLWEVLSGSPSDYED